MKALKMIFGAAILFCLLAESAAQAANPHVVSVRGKTVNIGIGSATSVRKGNLYLVYAEGQERLDLCGGFLGREKHSVAVIRINNVSKTSSSGEVIPGGGRLSQIQVGHRVEPISAEDAKYVSFVKRHAAEALRGGETYGY